MAKDEPTNQLNLTVVALVALVAIVGLVALVMNAASIKSSPLATGSRIASAQTSEEQNVAGDAKQMMVKAEYGEVKWYGGGCPAGTRANNMGYCVPDGSKRPSGAVCSSNAECQSGSCRWTTDGDGNKVSYCV